MNKLNHIIPVLLLLMLAMVLVSCEKEIEIDLPDAQTKLVVEGNIEQGRPPFVVLNKTSPYFEPTGINSLQTLFVRDELVTVSTGTNTVQITEICTNQLAYSLLPDFVELISV